MTDLPFKRIDCQQALELIDQGAVVADIRDEASFERGHISDARYLSNHNLQQFIEENDLDTPLLVCCYHGNSSQSAAAFLAERGFEEVYSIDGGFEAWQAQFPDRCDRP